LSALTAPENRRGAIGLLGVAAAAALMMVAVGIAQHDSQAPRDLRRSGLYADFEAKTIDPRNLAYSPQYPLWSDGEVKRRWIFLPPGSAIDASDPDVWELPKGTKVWKEFSLVPGAAWRR
jgi:hypothetical protein